MLSTTHAGYYSVYSLPSRGRFLHSSVLKGTCSDPGLEGCPQAGCDHLRPSLYSSWSHYGLDRFHIGWVGWPGIHSLDVVLLQKQMRTCVIVPEDSVRMPIHEWHNNGLENVIDVPFRNQVCPPQVWFSLWTTWPRAIFDTTSLSVASDSFHIVAVDTWNSSATVRTDFSWFQVPNHAVPNNSVSHSKIKPFKFDLLFLLCGKAFTHQWHIVNFCNFYFCTVEEQNECVHSCIKFIVIFFLQGGRELNFL